MTTDLTGSSAAGSRVRSMVAAAATQMNGTAASEPMMPTSGSTHAELLPIVSTSVPRRVHSSSTNCSSAAAAAATSTSAPIGSRRRRSARHARHARPSTPCDERRTISTSTMTTTARPASTSHGRSSSRLNSSEPVADRSQNASVARDVANGRAAALSRPSSSTHVTGDDHCVLVTGPVGPLSNDGAFSPQ